MENRLHAASPAAPVSPDTATFIQADATTFLDLVQKLTGLASDADNRRPLNFPLCSNSKPLFSGDDPIGPRRSPFKLQERRNQTMRKLEIKLGLSSIRNSPPPATKNYEFEPPIPTPAIPPTELQLFPSSGTESPSSSSVTEEEKAISEKGFYLHPSPLNTPRGSDPQPELLTLFPLTSPNQELSRILKRC